MNATGDTVCALDADGEVYCHGYEHKDGRCLVDGWEKANVQRAVEVAVVDAGACALDEDGQVWCWGAKDYSHVGVPLQGMEHFREPVKLDALTPVYQLRSYDDLVCALRANGEVWCWGHLYRGKDDVVRPVRIDWPPAIDMIVSWDSVCALLNDRSIRCEGPRVQKLRTRGSRDPEKPLPFEGKKPWLYARPYTLLDPPPDYENPFTTPKKPEPPPPPVEPTPPPEDEIPMEDFVPPPVDISQTGTPD